MSVSRDEVRRIAALARLDLTEEDGASGGDEPTVERLTGELNRILEHIATLEEADITGVDEPIRFPRRPVAFRDPKLVADALEADAPADRAPHWQEGFYVVPRLPALGDDEGEGS